MGFSVTNEPFEQNSWYFRNALVRGNYTNYERDIRPTLQPLVNFLENVMFDAHHVLRNRELHVDYQHDWEEHNDEQSASDPVTDPVTDPVDTFIFTLLLQLRDTPKSTAELMRDMQLTHRGSFRKRYLNPALAAGFIEWTIPDKPNSRLQKYRLTEIGRRVVSKQSSTGA